jgi:hypothetical protein
MIASFLITLLFISFSATQSSRIKNALLANRDIRGLFEMRMRQIEIDQPGSSLLFQGAALESNLNAAMGAKFLNNLSGQNLGPSKEEFKKYYKEKRARKKAKRAKKSEGK